MLDLNGIVSVEIIKELQEYTNLRFRNHMNYICAEALGLYEQKILPKEEIHAMCEKAVGAELIEPAVSYVPDNIVTHFIGTQVVPVSFSPIRGVVTCVYLRELGSLYTPIANYDVEFVETTIYFFFLHYIRHYGIHKDLVDVPAKQLLDAIVNEAIYLDAADVTITTVEKAATVYYNVRKTKVHSQRILTGNNMQDIIKYLTFESPMDMRSYAPKYVGVDLNQYYRGRVTINHKYKGYAITVRMLPNAAFEKTPEECNLSKETIQFLREDFMDSGLGLRVFAGSTMSGKNTTALSILREITVKDTYKIVSIEMPVEQELYGVEQINCDSEEDYKLNIDSLIRQNPDFVYITEIIDMTGEAIMKVTNTGKRVMSTIHANSCADVISRLLDITKLSVDRIIQTLHSIVYQELVRDEKTDTVKPKNRYVLLSKDRKIQLYGKPYGEVISKISSWEGGDVW